MFVEGPEHVENPWFAIREFSRVLKNSGLLVLTIPNYTSLEARLKFLLWGASEKAITPDLIKDKYGGDSSMAHISPMTYTQLRYFLEASGFEIQTVAQDRIKWKQYLLTPIAMIIWLVTWLSGKNGQRKWWARQANANEVLMGGNTLIIVALKTTS